LRCTHCGRPVRGTQHTRTTYRVDYYALHGGHGEACALVGDFAHHDTTFIRLLDHYEVISCAECYPLPTVRAERERLFRPEAFGSEEVGES
jgi:hypothetical protein